MLYAILTVLIGFNTLRRPSWFGVITFLASLGVVIWIVVSTLGTPAPIWLESTKDVKLLATSSDEPKTLYVWVLPKGSKVPVSIAMPWSEQLAEQAQQAMEQGKATGRGAKLHIGGMVRGIPRFYNSDIHALPDKMK